MFHVKPASGALLGADELTPTLVDPAARKQRRDRQAMLEETVFFRRIGLGWKEIADRLGVQEASLHKAVREAASGGLVIE